MVRVCLTPIQHWLKRVLNIRDVEFVCTGECVVDSVDRFVPLVDALFRRVALLQRCRMLLIVSL